MFIRKPMCFCDSLSNLGMEGGSSVTNSPTDSVSFVLVHASHNMDYNPYCLYSSRLNRIIWISYTLPHNMVWILSSHIRANHESDEVEGDSFQTKPSIVKYIFDRVMA